MSEEIKNNSLSLCDFKIETNSKGNNTSLHLYQGCTDDQMKALIRQAVKGHNYGQDCLSGKVNLDE